MTTNLASLKYYVLKLSLLLFIQVAVVPQCISQAINSNLSDSPEKNQEQQTKISNLITLGKEQFEKNLDSSRGYFFDALTIAFEINDKKNIANSSRFIGNSYWTEGNYDLAFQYYFDALGYYEAINDTTGIALSFNNIGEVYKKQGDYIVSLEYHVKSLDLKKMVGIIPLMSYYNIGELYYQISNLDSARFYFELVLDQSILPKDLFAASYAHSGLGKVYRESGYPSGSIFHHNTALDGRKILNNKRLMISSYIDLSEVFSDLGFYKKSYVYMDSAYHILNTINAKDLLVNYWLSKAKLDSSSNNFKSAYISIQRFHNLRDSLFSLDKLYQIEELKTKYYTEKTKRENETLIYNSELTESKLSQTRRVAIISTIALIIFVIITFLLAKSQKLIKNQRSQLAERAKTLEKALYDLNSTMEDNQSFSYSVSHDLKAPLRVLSFHTKVLLEELGKLNKQEIEEALEKLLQNILKMEIIIHDILELSMVTQLEVVYEQVDITELTQQCVKELEQEYPNRKVSIKIEKNMKASGDQGLLKILLKNLLGNAWKYSRNVENAQILVYTVNTDTICIEDNGAGFDMIYYEQIFKPFKRLHSEEEFEGSGIGLSIVERIIKKHQGTIYAESEIGKGSKFYFSV